MGLLEEIIKKKLINESSVTKPEDKEEGSSVKDVLQSITDGKKPEEFIECKPDEDEFDHEQHNFKSDADILQAILRF